MFGFAHQPVWYWAIDQNKPKVSVRSVSWTTSLIRWLVSGPLKLEVSQLLKTGTITTSTSLVNGLVVSTLQDLALRFLDSSKLTVHLDRMGKKTPISSGFNILISILDSRDAGNLSELPREATVVFFAAKVPTTPWTSIQVEVPLPVLKLT